MDWTLISVMRQLRKLYCKVKRVQTRALLKYPFVAGVAIEDAAKGLFLGEDPINISPDFLLTPKKEKAAPRNHFLHILQQDLDCLEPGEYLNDCVVDF